MVKRIGGNRRKTRAILKKEPRNRGKFSMTRFFQTFKEGEKVFLKAEPSIHKGMYFKRFNGRLGTIARKQGTCYFVTIDDLGKEKELIIHPIHLRKY